MQLIYVGGSKGGVGKSTICVLLADYIKRCSPEQSVPQIVDTDKGNPDVYRCHKYWTPPAKLMPLPVRDLWYKFLNLCETEEYQAMPYVLVNGAAGDIAHFTKGAGYYCGSKRSCGCQNGGYVVD